VENVTIQSRIKHMVRLIKLLIFLAVIGFIALIGYAYLGPYFGVDFSAPQSEVRKPVILDAN